MDHENLLKNNLHSQNVSSEAPPKKKRGRPKKQQPSNIEVTPIEQEQEDRKNLTSNTKHTNVSGLQHYSNDAFDNQVCSCT
jgi:hypothetical protein